MSNESEKTNAWGAEAPPTNGKRKSAKKAKPAKKARAQKPASKNADRINKKAEVIAMMKRAKGATLAGFEVSIIGRFSDVHRGVLVRNRNIGRDRRMQRGIDVITIHVSVLSRVSPSLLRKIGY